MVWMGSVPLKKRGGSLRHLSRKKVIRNFLTGNVLTSGRNLFLTIAFSPPVMLSNMLEHVTIEKNEAHQRCFVRYIWDDPVTFLFRLSIWTERHTQPCEVYTEQTKRPPFISIFIKAGFFARIICERFFFFFFLHLNEICKGDIRHFIFWRRCRLYFIVCRSYNLANWELLNSWSCIWSGTRHFERRQVRKK